MTNLEMNATFTRLAALERQQKELEKTVKEIRELLKAEMNARNIESIELPDFNATAKITVTNRLDSARLKKEQPSLYKEYTTESISQPLRYTGVK